MVTSDLRHHSMFEIISGIDWAEAGYIWNRVCASEPETVDRCNPENLCIRYSAQKYCLWQLNYKFVKVHIDERREN